MAAAAGALLLGLAAWALKARYPRQASALALAAACTGSIACEVASGDAWHGAIALGPVARAWVVVAVVTEWHWFVGLAGAFLMGSVACILSATDAPALVTVLVFVGLAGAFNALGAIGAFSPAGRLTAAGSSLAIAGCVALVFVAFAGWATLPGIGLFDAGWLDFGWHGVAFVLAALGGFSILQSSRYGARACTLRRLRRHHAGRLQRVPGLPAHHRRAVLDLPGGVHHSHGVPRTRPGGPRGAFPQSPTSSAC